MNVNKKAFLLVALVSASAVSPCLQAATVLENTKYYGNKTYEGASRALKAGYNKSAELGRIGLNRAQSGAQSAWGTTKVTVNNAATFAKNNKAATAVIIATAAALGYAAKSLISWLMPVRKTIVINNPVVTPVVRTNSVV